MGRRSINTTKSGKYMNPTDQARKEARKKELKKNKKQRQMVRAAVLKGKDPAQILEEMEKIDEMEYNVMQPSPLNEKVLREKRKKLKETFDRVMRLYHNDDPELWADLKRKENEYEKKRLKKQQYYESVKHAQTVQVDEIPLPQLPTGTGPQFPIPARIPIPAALPHPSFAPSILPGILKKPAEKLQSTQKSEEKPPDTKKKEPPGCPPGPPPDLHDMSELDTDAEDDDLPPLKKSKTIRFSDEGKDSRRTRHDSDDSRSASKHAKLEDPADVVKPTSLQQRMLAISGQNIDEFMKEMENVQKNKEKDDDDDRGKQVDEDEEDESSKSSSGDEDDESADESDSEKSDESEHSEPERPDIAPSIPLPPAPALVPPPLAPQSITLPSGPPPPPIGLPPAMLFRPPPLRPGIPGMAIRMPPGPPPGRPGMLPGGPGGLPPRLGIRMPPGPPPGLPPARLMHHHQKGQPPSIQAKDSKGVTTITAKPQIRNLSADVTRFVPSALRVRREDNRKPRPKQPTQEIKKIESNPGATKDDAYMQFMREMQGLL